MARTSLEKRSTTVDVSNRLLDAVATGFYPRARTEKKKKKKKKKTKEKKKRGEKRDGASLLVLESRIRKIREKNAREICRGRPRSVYNRRRKPGRKKEQRDGENARLLKR